MIGCLVYSLDWNPVYSDVSKYGLAIFGNSVKKNLFENLGTKSLESKHYAAPTGTAVVLVVLVNSVVI